MEYEGKKYFLSEDDENEEAVFLKDDCLVKIDVSKSDEKFRAGSV